MTAWDDLAVDLSAARLHASDHWTGDEIDVYLSVIDAALEPALTGRPKVLNVLDLGCGLGRLAVPFAERHRLARVVAVDSSARILELAEQGPTVDYMLNDGRTIPAGPIDAGWSVLMFQHVDDATMVGYLEQVAVLLRPGGRFLFQWVGPEAEAGPLSHPRDLATVAGMVADAGLVHLSHQHAIEDHWRWTVVEKGTE